MNKINYRRDLLKAVEAFLEKSPSSIIQAQQIVEYCHISLYEEFEGETIDQLIWGNMLSALTDKLFYKDELYLKSMQDLLIGNSSENIVRAIISEDYRSYFTPEEAECHRQLLVMLTFLTAFPFAEIHKAFLLSQQQKSTSANIAKDISEIKELEEEGEAEYQRRKYLIKSSFIKIPSPENIGDEKVYHLILREVASIITGIRIMGSARRYGYPTAFPPFRGEGDKINMSESIKWAQRAINAIEGKDAIFLSWRLSKASTFDTDVLLVSLH